MILRKRIDVRLFLLLCLGSLTSFFLLNLLVHKNCSSESVEDAFESLPPEPMMTAKTQKSWRPIFGGFNLPCADTRTGFPSNFSFSEDEFLIWQTWKTRDLQSFFGHTSTLLRKNPHIRFQICDDNDIDLFFKIVSPLDPIVNLAYESYKLVNPDIGAARADIFRYAILYYFGGMYLDVDAYCKPDVFEELQKISNEYDIILAQEANRLSYNEFVGRNMLVQWAIISKSQNPILKTVIRLVYDNLIFKSERRQIRPMTMHTAVVQMMGPSAFSRAFDAARLFYPYDEIRWYMHPTVDFGCKAKQNSKMMGRNHYAEKSREVLRKSISSKLHSDYEKYESEFDWLLWTRESS